MPLGNRRSNLEEQKPVRLEFLGFDLLLASEFYFSSSFFNLFLKVETQRLDEFPKWQVGLRL